MRICFIFAMKEEAKSFINYLNKIKLSQTGASYKKVNNNLLHFSFKQSFIFFEKVLGISKDNKTDIFISFSGIGKVNAAIFATEIIQQYQVKLLVNIGTSGALNPNLNLTDIFLIKKFIYYDVDVTTFNYEYGQVPKMPKFYEINKNLYKNMQNFFNSKKFKIKSSNLATGDSFLSLKNVKILNNIKNINCELIDMEATSYAQVSYVMNCSFISFKIVSDYVSSKNNNLSHAQNMKLCNNKIKQLASVIFS